MGAKAEKSLGQTEEPQTMSEGAQGSATSAAGKLEDVKDHLEKDLRCCGRKCCSCWTRYGMKILLIILTIISMMLGVAVVVNALVMAQAVTAYNPDNSGRAVAMIILVISCCCSGAAALFANAAAFKKKTHSLKITGVVLAILALVQLLIAVLSGMPGFNEEATLTRSLQESFNKALLHNPKAVEQWSITQYTLSCCGINSPQDYRSGIPPYFPPDVPISCCPAYQPSRSDLVQEKERERCKAREEFYEKGCKGLVVTVFADTGIFLTSLTVVLLFFQIGLAVTSYGYACIAGRRKKSSNAEASADVAVTEVALK